MQMNSLARRNQRSIARCAFVFLLPVALLMTIYLFYPIVQTFVNSFTKWNGISANKTFTGLTNWLKLASDPDFWRAFLNNVKIMVLSLVIQMPIGILLATFLDATGKKGNLFKVLWFLPLLMSSVAVGYLFRYTLATNGGVISSLSKLLGGKNVDLLGNQGKALYAVIAVICWQFIPFYMVYYMAGYSSISTDVYEAAVVDGATRAQYVVRIALPLLVPTIKSAVIMSVTGSLKYFDLVYVMTGGGPGTSTELMATYMYKNSFVTYNMGYGSTIAAGMFILITLVAMLIMRVMNRGGDN
ncbi:MAG: sugar ABC transporter permease [Eubacteriales bacterium]|nr:sugar ABC transporter permease [Eubacteriales bacterium]